MAIIRLSARKDTVAQLIMPVHHFETPAQVLDEADEAWLIEFRIGFSAKEAVPLVTLYNHTAAAPSPADARLLCPLRLLFLSPIGDAVKPIELSLINRVHTVPPGSTLLLLPGQRGRIYGRCGSNTGRRQFVGARRFHSASIGHRVGVWQ